MIGLLLAVVASGLTPQALPYTAPLTAVVSGDVCKSPVLAGFSNSVIAFSLNVGRTDGQCERLKGARALTELGYREAAVQLLCTDKRIEDAMAKAGTPCGEVSRSVNASSKP